MAPGANSPLAMESGLAPTDCYRTTDASGNSYTEGVAVSGTTTFYGTPITIQRLHDSSFHLTWAGTPTGVWTVWVSNKASPGLSDDTDWVQLTLAVAINQPAGAAGKDFVDLAGLPSGFARMKYVNASGTGTVHAYPAGKS